MTSTPDIAAVKERLAEWKALADAATPGPWRVIVDDTGGPFTSWPSVEAPDDLDTTIIQRAGFKQEHWGDLSLRDTLANAAFIAASRTAVPELLALISSLEGERDEAEAEADRLRETVAEYRASLLSSLSPETGKPSTEQVKPERGTFSGEGLNGRAGGEPTAASRSGPQSAGGEDRAALVTLADCPIGLFRCGGELCLKTEYGNNEGRIDAYIVSSGEFFWGEQPQTIASQRAQLVEPVALAVRSAT